MREHDVISADGTRIRVWRTDADGPDVLLSPGLGAAPAVWPELPGARVHTWHHRGTLDSDRPADPSRVELADHVADALAVLDGAGVDRCVVMGWSMGVTVAAELALRHPERVTGLMLVTGAPGDSFAGFLGVPGLPVELRRLLGVAGVTALKAAGPLLDAVLHRVPVPTVGGPLVESVRRYLGHDWRWYCTLALALGRTPRLDLTGVTCPTTVLAGRYDFLAAPEGVVTPVAGLPQARVRLLPNTHFLPLENPRVVVEELALLLDRADAVRRAVDAEARPGADLGADAPEHVADAVAAGALTSRSRPRA
ncbi:alpha/beta fold hydrolase [Saccharothrix hoggarensis]|uniref:Alpha/beta fold hydrolase n=1 Tax=Saccharothrix hoggarensis TaxID=913853 RepID=A0ABW3QN70_9PSEU